MKEEKRLPGPDGHGVGDGSSGFSQVGSTDRPRRRPFLSTSVAVLSLMGALASLAISLFWSDGRLSPEALRDFFGDETPHQAYLKGLADSGLAGTALGRDWMAASRDALIQPLRLDLPYLEEGFFPRDEPQALGYRFSLRRGQRLTVQVEVQGSTPGRLFLDLFRVAPDTLRPPVHVFSPEVGEVLDFEPRRTGDYLLRVQPELLRGGRFRVTIQNQAALNFPVEGRTDRAIGSFFGDARDGGRRDHHGVDIFAPRGTPVLATSEAYVRRVDTTEIGGRVIWLSDQRRGASVYYAHLNEPLVTEGTRVQPGDTIGTVGNTGNARTTPPHLHFGLYFRGEGPIDPWDYLYQPRGEVRPVEVAVEGLGGWARVKGEEINLRDEPGPGGNLLSTLPTHTALRVTGGVGEWFRVRLPDGTGGFVSGRLTEDADMPLRLERFSRDLPIRSEPDPGAPVMDRLLEETELPVLGTFGSFLCVRDPSGRTGWVME